VGQYIGESLEKTLASSRCPKGRLLYYFPKSFRYTQQAYIYVVSFFFIKAEGKEYSPPTYLLYCSGTAKHLLFKHDRRFYTLNRFKPQWKQRRYTNMWLHDYIFYRRTIIKTPHDFTYTKTSHPLPTWIKQTLPLFWYPRGLTRSKTCHVFSKKFLVACYCSKQDEVSSWCGWHTDYGFLTGDPCMVPLWSGLAPCVW
jgi:hypothetical protein